MIKQRLFLFLFTALFLTPAYSQFSYDGLNKDGSIVSAVVTAAFDPSNGVLPFPHNLLFTGTKDLTLNVPVANPANFGDPKVALNAGDGFSTTERWVASFLDTTYVPNRPAVPAALAPASVTPGHSVRVFQVTTVQFLVVTSIVRELTPGVEFVAVASGNNVAILPLLPLKEYSSYMAVLTNDITDVNGNNATPSQTYFFTKKRTPWVDANGHSTYSLISDAQAQALEPLRRITQSMELNAAAYGVNPDDIVLSWTIQTESITPVLKSIRSTAHAGPTTVAPTGLTTAAVGGAGIADIYMGIITVPYYLGVPTAENPTAPLTAFWKAAPGAYVPPYNQFGLDPTSTNVTFANPFPVKTSDQTVPLLMTVPNANSHMSRPAAGWPVVIFGHGITRNRTDMLAIADTMASIGYAVIAMDAPLHGVVPQVTPAQAPFYVGNTPFGAVAHERTFNVDYINNATGAPGPDGIPDPSGTHIINLTSMLTSRDNLRQGETDLSVLTLSIPGISYNGDSVPDLDGSNITFVGQSMGSIMGTVFTTVEPNVSRAFLSVPMGGLARGLEASQTFGPRIRAGLAALGVLPGTTDYETFFTVLQTVIDSGDPINWSIEASTFNDIMLHEVIGDTVVPNYVATAPLSGTEPMIRTMDLTPYSSTQVNPDGLTIAGRFLPPATHGSLLDPSSSPASTVEMQREAASFVVSQGTFVQVSDPSVLVPVVQVQLTSGGVDRGAVELKSNEASSSAKPVRRNQTERGFKND